MSDFRTIISIPRSPVRMAISDRIFTIGSCFSDAIGKRLADFKLSTFANPAGVLYNPVSIQRVLNLAIQGVPPSESNYTDSEPVFHHDFHSSQFATTAKSLQDTLEQVLSDCRASLEQSTWLIITYGTAWVYRRNDNDEIVANCHKQPSSLFRKSLLSPGDVESSFRSFYAALRVFHPHLKVILTISPVRHVKDTLEGNAVSKSVLRVACENITHEHRDVYYFPSYEIMMDDLRDYRFYKPDMIHPNEVAEDYLWEKFSATWFDDQLLTFIASWKSIRQALQHRPFHPDTAAHRQFLQSTLHRISEWSDYVNTEAERELITAQMISAEGVRGH